MTAMNKNAMARYAFVAIPVVWLLAVSVPEVFRDRIFPFDSALIAANGALFERLFSEFVDFLSAPADWLWGYYDQYPAMSVRRHPPLFGIASGIVYSIAGVSASAAKFTVMLFGCVFVAGTYALSCRILGSVLLAGLATLLVVATPEIAMHFYSVWLDIPSLAFAIWVLYFYVRRIQGDTSLRNAILLAGFAVLALYTYQPVVLLLAGVFVHLLIREWRTLFTDRPMLIAAAGLVVAMLPLIAFTLYFARDNLLITVGEIPKEWKEFGSPGYADWMIRDKFSLAYWTVYGRMLLQSAPLQVVGVIVWAVLRFWRRPSTEEVMLFLCVVVTYVGFSWLLVKGHRYTLYMMIPASLLCIAAFRDVAAQLFRERSRAMAIAAAISLALILLQFIAVRPYAPYLYLSGMNDPVARILEDTPDAQILYSGRNDAAFVFYTRSLDDTGTARVHRASVQLTDTDDIEMYLVENDIDYVVLEIDNPGYDSLEVIDEFRESILHFVGDKALFAIVDTYSLPFGVSDDVGNVSLSVYKQLPRDMMDLD